MIRGLGNDIIGIERFRKSIERHGQKFLDKLFTPAEQEYCLRFNDSVPRFAGRFSAKEAISKVFGTGFGEHVSFLEIEILNDNLGKPHVNFSDKINQTFGNPEVLISISHSEEFATAVAIWH